MILVIFEMGLLVIFLLPQRAQRTRSFFLAFWPGDARRSLSCSVVSGQSSDLSGRHRRQLRYYSTPGFLLRQEFPQNVRIYVCKYTGIYLTANEG